MLADNTATLGLVASFTCATILLCRGHLDDAGTLIGNVEEPRRFLQFPKEQDILANVTEITSRFRKYSSYLLRAIYDL